MRRGERPGPGGPPPDPRLRGFADRVALELAVAWIDAVARRLPAVEVDLAHAVDRVPAAQVVAPADLPAADRAGEDGWAVRAADTVGASAWGPAPLRREDRAAALAPGTAALVAAGAPLPAGADAVLPFDAAEAQGLAVEVLAPVAEGSGVERAGHALRAGAAAVGAGRPLRAQDAALLAAAGVARVAVVRRPRVRLVVAGPKEPGAHDAHGPMLAALVVRDGGELEVERAALADALPRAVAGADVVVATGRTGAGGDDGAAAAVARAGELAVHGVALRPGGSAAVGVVDGCPVVLLPGDPVACLCAYELLAGRLVRALGGRDPGLPHPRAEGEVARKLASAVGVVEVCQVRLASGRVEPLGVADYGGIAAAAAADGFVVIPAEVEGYAPGARVTVHLYGSAGGAGWRTRS